MSRKTRPYRNWLGLRNIKKKYTQADPKLALQQFAVIFDGRLKSAGLYEAEKSELHEILDTLDENGVR